MDKPRVSMVVAIGRNRVIGKANVLLWHIPEDLKRFKALTVGHPVIMGRKTFDSIVGMIGKPLPGRTNIVITRDSAWAHEGVVSAQSVEEALEKAARLDRSEVFVIGGAQIYAAALEKTDRLYLTLIDDEKAGDAYFPPYEHRFTKVISEEIREQEGLRYRWVNLER